MKDMSSLLWISRTQESGSERAVGVCLNAYSQGFNNTPRSYDASRNVYFWRLKYGTPG